MSTVAARYPHISLSASEALRKHSGVLIGVGALIAGIGAWAMIANLAATVISVYTLGVLVFAAGCAELALAFFGRSWRGVASHLIIGILQVVVGVFLLRAPLMGASTITLLFSAWLLASGVSELAHGLLYRHEKWKWTVASGAVSSFFGAVLLARWPIGSLALLGAFVGISLIFHGTTWISLGLAVRRDTNLLEAARR